MKERPILFSGAMVRALLDGSKTQTRRVCKPAQAASLSCVIGIQDPRDFGQRPLEVPGSGWFGDEDGEVQFACPYGRPGDRLWVRETWAEHPDFPGCRRAIYRADPECEYDTERWRPSIHMPRWACRILLEIVSLRVERLQAINDQDAMAEGVDASLYGKSHRYGYSRLWEEINGAGSWSANPWVWVVEFKRGLP